MKSSQSPIRELAKVVFGGTISLDTTIPNNCLEESWANYDSVYVNHIADHDNLIWINKVLNECRHTIMLCKFDVKSEWFCTASKRARLGLVLKEDIGYDHDLAVFLFNTNNRSRTFIEVFSDIGYFLY